MRNKRTLAVAAALLVTCIWGFSFVVVKDAVDRVTPVMFITCRYLIAAPLMAALCWKKLRHLSREDVKAAFGCGLPLAAAHALQTVGAQGTSASNAALITGLYMIFVPLLAPLFRGKLQPRALAIAFLAFGGLAALTLNQQLQIAGGDIWVLAGAVGFGIHFHMVNRWAKRYDALYLTALQFIAAAIILVPTALLTEPLPSAAVIFGWPMLGQLFFCALIVTMLGFCVQTAVQSVLEPAPASVLFTSEALFGAIFGILINGDQFLPRQALGAVVLLACMVVSVLPEKPHRSLQQAHSQLKQPIPASKEA